MLIENFKRYHTVLQSVYDEASSLETAQAPLVKALKDQLNDVHDDEDLKEGVYLQAALTDELFIPKMKEWKKQMLEHTLFNSQNA